MSKNIMLKPVTYLVQGIFCFYLFLSVNILFFIKQGTTAHIQILYGKKALLSVFMIVKITMTVLIAYENEQNFK